MIKDLSNKYGCGSQYMRIAILSSNDNEYLINCLKAEVQDN